MTFLVTLAITITVVFLLRSPLKKYPWLFYLLAILLCAISLWLFFLPAAERPTLLTGFQLIMRRGYIALALFTLVMFVGVFSDESFFRRALQPIRAELSIIAAVLIVGHFSPYLMGYLSHIAHVSLLRINIAVSLGISLILLILLIVLTLTSFIAVKRWMKPASWKRVQQSAYVFFLLVYAHLAGFLLPAALQGSPVALRSIVVYGLVFISYVVLRIRRALGARKSSLAETT
jgi:DMSO/TMAO reductase YedYZ heme-binding membrane subunit